MKKAFWAFGILAFLATTAAMAADVVAPAPAFDWSGPYVGLQAANVLGTYNNVVDGGVSLGSYHGLGGGINLGWNAQSQNLVYGIVADADFVSVDGVARGAGANAATPNLNLLGSLRANVGFAQGPALIYLTGGLAAGSENYQITNGITTESTAYTPLGYTVGAGIDLAVSQKVSVGVEYRYTDMGSKTIPSALFPTDVFVSDNKFSAVRANIALHF